MSATTKVSRVIGLAVLALVALGCAPPVTERAGEAVDAGWYIKVNISVPAAPRAITVNEYDVTALQVEVRDPDQELLQAISWEVAEGPQSYTIPVEQPGEHEIVVTHVGQKDGQMMEATESATFNIAAMVITVIDLVPGSIGVIKIAGGGEQSEPLDLNGYWDIHFTPEGGDEDDVERSILPLQQLGTQLLSGYGLSGSLVGTEFFLETYLEDEGTIFHGVMEGTASQNEIAGDFTGLPFGDGTFLMVPWLGPFGHLDVSGTFQGQPVSLDTEYGFATTHTSTFWGYNIGLNTGGLDGLYIGTEEHELEVGELDVDEAYWSKVVVDGQEATGGWIDITGYSEAGMTGTFDLYFENGHLTGSFDLAFGGGGGEISVTGTWMGNPVSGSTTNASAERSVRVKDNLDITYIDVDLLVNLWISVNGYLTTGVHVSPEAGVDVRWGGEGDEISSTSCELHIEELTEEAVAGSLTAVLEGGDSVTANFAMDLAEGSID